MFARVDEIDTVMAGSDPFSVRATRTLDLVCRIEAAAWRGRRAAIGSYSIAQRVALDR